MAETAAGHLLLIPGVDYLSGALQVRPCVATMPREAALPAQQAGRDHPPAATCDSGLWSEQIHLHLRVVAEASLPLLQ